MDNTEIARLREERGRVANARGTLFHYHCEAHCNGRVVEAPHSPEFRMFSILLLTFRQMGFYPFRTEVCLFHVGLRVAGQLDALFRSESDGHFALVDWKRCKSIRFDDKFQTMRPPLDNLPDCNGSLYALQLNFYRYILESEYGCHIGENMFLGVCHPDLQEPRLIRVPHLQDEVDVVRAGGCLRSRILRSWQGPWDPEP